jgi:hypothetical protein
VICAISQFSMAHNGATTICAVVRLRLREKGNGVGCAVAHFPTAHQWQMAHLAAAKKRTETLVRSGKLMKRKPPDLQTLVAAHGGYDKITHEAWAEYDTQVAAWQAYIRRGGDWQESRRTLVAAPKRPMSLRTTLPLIISARPNQRKV